MKKRLIDLRSEIPILDIASYGRGAPRSFTPVERAQIARTVGRAPEVMVKVSGGARTLGGVGAHLAYIGRDDFEIETDMGERIHERASQRALLEDWDLDLETHWHQSARAINEPSRSPKLVHNIIFSMPPGTDPKKVLEAVRRFAVNEWALKHRYAMVLHTNEAHPHVHVVVKARSEQGQRLNIRKATLRNWRTQFAENLRDLGVAANATERAVRGKSITNLPDRLYLANKHRESTYLHKRALTLYDESRDSATLTPDNGRAKMLATRQAVEGGWRNVSLMLTNEGYRELAQQAQRFVDQMRPPPTEMEIIAFHLQRPKELSRAPTELRTR
jgi:type IV secretory pathway VirD2 relaxase